MNIRYIIDNDMHLWNLLKKYKTNRVLIMKGHIAKLLVAEMYMNPKAVNEFTIDSFLGDVFFNNDKVGNLKIVYDKEKEKLNISYQETGKEEHLPVIVKFAKQYIRHNGN